MPIDPKYYTLKELLSYNIFFVPDFQRLYSWTTSERSALFSDIKNIMLFNDKNRHHFMSTIVCYKNGKIKSGPNEYNKMELVDGQQRLTTLVILLKSIHLNLIKQKNENQKYKDDLRNLLIKDTNNYILLQTNHFNSKILNNFIRDGKVENETNLKVHADLNLVKAFDECNTFVNEWFKEYKSALTLLDILNNRLGFIFFTLDNKSEVYTVFEVLNDRGLNVDTLDKCKSLLMGILFNKLGKRADTGLKEINKIWTDIYLLLGEYDINGEEVVRFAVTLMSKKSLSKPVKNDEALKFIFEKYSKNPSNIVKFTEFLLRITETLKYLFSNERIRAVTKISQARLLAVSIKYSKEYLNKINAEEEKILLEQWERVTFRIYGLFSRDSKKCVGKYVNLARKIYKEKIDFHNIFELLVEIGKEYPIGEAVKEIKNTNCYKDWDDELRYFFYCKELSLSKNPNNINEKDWNEIWKNPSVKSIEHIYPQNPRGNKKLNERNVHRLGNLLILTPSINSECQDKMYVKKKKNYQRAKLFIVDEFTIGKYKNLSKWTIKNIVTRENGLLKFAKTRWMDLDIKKKLKHYHT